MARQASVSLTVSAPPYTHVTYEVSQTGETGEGRKSILMFPLVQYRLPNTCEAKQ